MSREQAVRGPMVGTMLESDFTKDTITFHMPATYYAAAGRYIIEPEGDWLRRKEQLAALSQPQAASSTQAAEDDLEGLAQAAAALDVLGRRELAGWIMRIHSRLASSTTPGSSSDADADDWASVGVGTVTISRENFRALRAAATRAPGVDSLPAKWREAAERLEAKAKTETPITRGIFLARAECYHSCADQLEAAITQPAQQGDGRKECTCEGRMSCGVQAGKRLGDLWRCRLGHENQPEPAQQGERGESNG